MFERNLAQLTQRIEDEYAKWHSYDIPTEKVALTQSGRLSVGKNEFTLGRDASKQLARMLKVSTFSPRREHQNTMSRQRQT